MVIVIQPYRGTTCDNPECSKFGKEIKPNLSWAEACTPQEIMNIGTFRDFCDECGDGAGWDIKDVILDQ